MKHMYRCINSGDRAELIPTPYSAFSSEFGARSRTTPHRSPGTGGRLPKKANKEYEGLSEPIGVYLALIGSPGPIWGIG